MAETIIGVTCLVLALVGFIALDYDVRKMAREHRKWVERETRRANRSKMDDTISTSSK